MAIDENHPLFNELVALLEDRKLDDFVKKVEEEEKRNLKELKKILSDQDKRLEEELKDYQFRYRPIMRGGNTILHYAMIYGNKEVVEKLLELKANPMIRTQTKKTTKIDGTFTVVHCPCYIGNLETLKALFTKAKDDDVKELVSLYYRHTFVDKKESAWEWTPLHYAVGRSNVKLVKLLLKHKADPMEGDGAALRYASKVASFDIIKVLVNEISKKIKRTGSAISLKEFINHQDKRGLTSLHYSCQKKCGKTTKYLLKHGGDPTIEDEKGNTPLHYAILKGAEKCAITLLEEDKFLPKHIKKVLSSETIYSELIHQDSTGVMIKLLNIFGAGYQKFQLKGKKMLHQAVCSDTFYSEDFVQIVKGLGKNCIEEKDEEDLTPMMLAASQNKSRKLRMIFHAYLELLEEDFFTVDKKHYQHLYKHIIVAKDKMGLSMLHLAIRCAGSDSDFEETVNVIEEIYNKLKSMAETKEWKADEKDPFQVKYKCPGKRNSRRPDEFSAVDLAFKYSKPKRAIVIIKIADRTLCTLDTNILHSALQSEIQAEDFERLTNLIINSNSNYKDIMIIFNSMKEKQGPLHLALMKKYLYPHAKVLLRTKLKTEREEYAVELKTGGKAMESPLNVALKHGCPEDIIDIVAERTISENNHKSTSQLRLPMDEGVELMNLKIVIDKVESTSWVDTANKKVFLNNLLYDAVEKKRSDIFKMLIVDYDVSMETLKHVILTKEDKNFSRLIIRFSKDTIFKKLRDVHPKVVQPEVVHPERKILFNELILKMPDVALEALNRSISISGQKIDPNYTLLKDSEDQSKESNKDIAHPLDKMVSSDNQDKLLQHPLVKSYLYSEWERTGLWLCLTQIILYSLFLAVFSGLVQIVRYPIEENFNSSTAHSSANRYEKTERILSLLSMVFVAIQLAYFIVYAGGQLYARKTKKYYNLVFQVVIFLMVFIFSLASLHNAMYNKIHSQTMWRVGITAIIFAWSNLIILGSNFTQLGEYALFFVSILKSFLHLMIFGILLVLASTIVLRMIFYSPLQLSSPFYTFQGSIIKIFTSITGEIDFHDTLNFTYNADNATAHNLYDHRMAYIVWIIFLVVIPILLSNMLIALAVGDASEVHKNATTRKLELLTYWITTLHSLKMDMLSKLLQKLLDWLFCMILKETAVSKQEKLEIQLYHKDREDDIAKIKEKNYSKRYSSTDAEKLQTIQEVATSSQNNLHEMKVVNDFCFHRVLSGQAYLMRSARNSQ